MELIGITGKKFSGKSTLAEMIRIISSTLSYEFVELAFATPLKEICAKAYSIDENHFYESKLKEVTIDELGKSPRQIMQEVGTYFRGEKDKNGDTLWIRHMRNKINLLAKSEKKIIVIISDVRYLDEANMIRDLGGKIIRVIGYYGPDIDNYSQHSSEQEMDAIVIDETIGNTGSKRSLQNKIMVKLNLKYPKESTDQNTTTTN